METNMDQHGLWLSGIDKSKKFLELNNIPIPFYVNKDLSYESDRKTTGLYSPNDNTVYVDLSATAKPVQSPRMRSWSWPGYKIDRTPQGVVLHETGHHVEYWLLKQRAFDSKQWKSIITGERRPVSGYEPNHHEAFAETMRLFIGNPNLLRHGCPQRYFFCNVMLGLRQSETRDYLTVIANPNYTAAAQRWCRL
jgi:hypothetical protein